MQFHPMFASLLGLGMLPAGDAPDEEKREPLDPELEDIEIHLRADLNELARRRQYYTDNRMPNLDALLPSLDEEAVRLRRVASEAYRARYLATHPEAAARVSKADGKRARKEAKRRENEAKLKAKEKDK